MAERYLTDSSAAIKYLNATFPEKGMVFLDKELNKERIISFVTEIELLSWNPPDILDISVYELFIKSAQIISIDDNIIRETIAIRKSHNLKIPDAIIAATAIIHNFTLISDNDKDFGKVKRLKHINPKML